MGIIVTFIVLQVVSILLGANLATFDFKNRGIIRIVPTDTLSDRVVLIAPPRPLTHQQLQQSSKSDEPLL